MLVDLAVIGSFVTSKDPVERIAQLKIFLGSDPFPGKYPDLIAKATAVLEMTKYDDLPAYLQGYADLLSGGDDKICFVFQIICGDASKPRNKANKCAHRGPPSLGTLESLVDRVFDEPGQERNVGKEIANAYCRFATDTTRLADERMVELDRDFACDCFLEKIPTDRRNAAVKAALRRYRAEVRGTRSN